jgi:hypothetical protein
MKASEYGIKNLEVILPMLPKWTKEEADKYDNLDEMYHQVEAQFSRYMGHVLRNVGGVYETFHSVEEPGDVYEPTPKARQREAVAFLNQQLFETPRWLLDTAILNRISNPSNGDPVGPIQTGVLSSLLSSSRLNILLLSAERYGEGNVYSVENLLSDLRKSIWKELTTHQRIDVYRRNLQKTYVESLISVVNPSTPSFNSPGLILFFGPNTKNTDLPSIAKAELTSLRSQIQAALPETTDQLSRYHLADLSDRIRKVLNPWLATP